MKMNQNANGIETTTDMRIKKHFDEVFEKFRTEVGDYEFTKLVESTFSKMEMNVAIKLDESLVEKGEIGGVYYVDFGYGYGSETRYGHYCVPVVLSGATALVVPLTSKAGNRPSPRVEIGVIVGLNSRKYYGLIHNMTSISTARLMPLRVDGKEVMVKLEKEQLDALKSNLINFLQKA